MENHSSKQPPSKNPYSLPVPYPIPRVIEENPYYASILLKDYSGASGELTAINQYIYHYITLENSQPDLSTLARQVAIIEMHHLELLGKTIQLLGLYPTFHCTNKGVMGFWNAGYVHYGDDVYDKLSANIDHEAAAIHNYRRHQQQIDDPCIQELLERIILDEEYHLQLFSQYREEFCNFK